MCKKNNYKLIVIYMKCNGVKWYWLYNFSSSVVLLPRFHVLFSYSSFSNDWWNAIWVDAIGLSISKIFVSCFFLLWIWINESFEWLTKTVLKIKWIFYEHFKCFWWKLIGYIGNLILSFNWRIVRKILSCTDSTDHILVSFGLIFNKLLCCCHIPALNSALKCDRVQFKIQAKEYTSDIPNGVKKP